MSTAPVSNVSGGGNPSGYNISQLPSLTGNPIGTPTPVGSNPLLPQYPSNNQSAPIYSPYSFPANGSGTPDYSNINGILNGGSGNPAQPQGGTGANPLSGLFSGHASDIGRGLVDAGVPSNIASSLAEFLKSGAGFNQNAINAIFAALQPQINRGEADINEHFGSMGLGMSSPAAIGLGDFLSQVNLNEGQIEAQLYEQSIQNYLEVLLGSQSHSRGINSTIQDVTSTISGIQGIITGLKPH